MVSSLGGLLSAPAWEWKAGRDHILTVFQNEEGLGVDQSTVQGGAKVGL